MGAPAATATTAVQAMDTHIVQVPSPGGPVPTPLPHAFSGQVSGGTIASVTIGGQAAAVEGSTATNSPAHVPTPPGVAFVTPPTNRGSIAVGSRTVLIGGRPAARIGDPVTTCNDPADAPVGQLLGSSTVVIGG